MMSNLPVSKLKNGSDVLAAMAVFWEIVHCYEKPKNINILIEVLTSLLNIATEARDKLDGEINEDVFKELKSIIENKEEKDDEK